MPPKEDATFVANMEDVLEIYKRPYNSAILGYLYGRTADTVDQGNAQEDTSRTGQAGTFGL